MKTMLALFVVAGCGTPSRSVNFCDASDVRVNGQPLGDLAVADGVAPAGCVYFTTADILNAQLFEGADKFGVTVKRVAGEQQLTSGNGGALVQWQGIDCTAYGDAELESDLPDWRIRLDNMRCPDGTVVTGSIFGHVE